MRSTEKGMLSGHAKGKDSPDEEASAEAEDEESGSHDQDAFTGVVLTA